MADPGFKPAEPRLRKLLGWEYESSIRDLLGQGAAAVVTPPPDAAVSGFESIAASQLTLSTSALEAYEKSARAAATAVTNLAPLLGCVPAAIDDAACMRTFLTTWGRRAWRRPLADDELARWTTVGQEAARAWGDFNGGARAVIWGLLQSPHFIYQVVIGTPDATDPTRRKLTGLELATRMSYFVAGTTPPVALLDAAQRGELDTADGVRAHARTLLAGGKGQAALSQFFGELLELRDLPGIDKDKAVFPAFAPALLQAMAQETTLLIEDIVWKRDADSRDILDAPYSFLNSDLAKLYGVPAPAGTTFQRVEFPAGSRRGGLLGHGSFLAGRAHETSTSPTLRGKFIRETLLCQAIPAPPPNVDTQLPPDPPGVATTMRQKIDRHLTDPTCASCHLLMDPLGLGLESFDGMGAYRTQENGLAIDASSELEGKPFAGAAELGKLLRTDPEVTRCLVRNLFRHASGHVEVEGETRPLKDLDARFAAGGYKLQGLLVELAASDVMRYLTPAEGSP